MKTRIEYLFSGLVIFALLLSACSTGQTGPTEGAPEVTETAPELTEAAPKATTAAEATDPAVATGEVTGPILPETGEQPGGKVTVMGVWVDADLDNFLVMVAPFEEKTGVDVEYQHARDLTTILDAGIQSGSPPDIAGLPNLDAMRRYAEQEALLPLDDVIDTARLQEEYPDGLTELSKVNGQFYGVFVKAAVKSLVWYRPDVFRERGYQVPQSWEELQSLEQQIISEGAAPWCIGVSTRWPGTDWIEDMMLRVAGPETYDAWLEHAIPWTDPAVATAWESWGRIVGDPAMVYGGPSFVLSRNDGESTSPMFDEEPGCFLHRQASFFATFMANQYPEVALGEDLDFFPLPAIDAQHGKPLLVAGDLFGIFNDTPQARALMEYLTSAEAQSIWAEKGGYIAPNREVPTEVYPDEISRQMAESYIAAESVRFDASDLMPQTLQDAFFSGVLDFVQDPGELQTVLEGIESAAQDAYAQ